MDIKVLGTGCANGKTTIALIDARAAHAGGSPNRDKIELWPSA